MRHYELVTILSPMLNQEEASAAWDEIKTFISNREGEITAEQAWGTRRLAYPIRKGNYNFLEGSYYLSSFTVDNPINRELENYLRLDERVLRSLVIKCDGPLADRPAPGPLTAPSRYIPPGRGRRPDGGGPIPDGAGSFGDRRSGPPPAGTPAAPSPVSGDAPAATAEPVSEPAPVPVAEPTPEAVAEAPPDAANEASPETAAEAPAETVAEAPSEATAEAQPEATAEAPSEATVDAPPEATADAPPEATADAPPEATADAPPAEPTTQPEPNTEA